MKAAIELASGSVMLPEDYLDKYVSQRSYELEAIRGSFEEHCAARAVVCMRNAGVLFKRESSKEFQIIREALIEAELINQKKEDVNGEEVHNVRLERRSRGKSRDQ